AGLELNDAAISLFVDHVLDRLRARGSYPTNRGGGPFYERGELSELHLFHTNTNFPLPNVNMNLQLDRSREEIVKRLIEMICTRGNTFTVYCVGQAVRELADGSIEPQGLQSTRVTFRLIPDYGGAPGPSPSQFEELLGAGDREARFSLPVRFQIEVIDVINS
ncbi:MAG: hypothetical protein ACFCU3_05435, partial [Verrucomicrobiales bacterium]